MSFCSPRALSLSPRDWKTSGNSCRLTTNTTLHATAIYIYMHVKILLLSGGMQDLKRVGAICGVAKKEERIKCHQRERERGIRNWRHCVVVGKRHPRKRSQKNKTYRNTKLHWNIKLRDGHDRYGQSCLMEESLDEPQKISPSTNSSCLPFFPPKGKKKKAIHTAIAFKRILQSTIWGRRRRKNRKKERAPKTWNIITRRDLTRKTAFGRAPDSGRKMCNLWNHRRSVGNNSEWINRWIIIREKQQPKRNKATRAGWLDSKAQRDRVNHSTGA